MKILRIMLIVIVLLFAAIGMLFTAVYIAMQFGLLNVRGSIDSRNSSIESASVKADIPVASSSFSFGNPTVTTGIPDENACMTNTDTCQWSDTRQWSVVAGGLSKDLPILQKVGDQTGVSPRMIAAVVVPEQIRFFTSNREIFKSYFEPLKILGSLSKFSLGVSGIKQDTARTIEENANDKNSTFYPGDAYAALLAYAPGVDHDTELFNRLTNEKDHYYSYLYTAIFIKEILQQWKNAGYDISNEPAIVATIFNIGFGSSHPNPNPQVGGAPITVGGKEYSFGALAGLFYESPQLPGLLK